MCMISDLLQLILHSLDLEFTHEFFGGDKKGISSHSLNSSEPFSQNFWNENGTKHPKYWILLEFKS